MPRDGSGIYSTPPGTHGTPNTTILSANYNSNVDDVAADLNTARPIVAGGTGATDASTALKNLGGEQATQVITNYDSGSFVAGSFYSASGATNPPVAGHAFSGICYLTDASNMFIEARDQNDTVQPGTLYVRQKKAGVWSAWLPNAYLPLTGGTVTGPLLVNNTAGALTVQSSTAGGNSQIYLNDSSGTQRGALYWEVATTSLVMNNFQSAGGVWRIDGSQNASLLGGGNAYKAGGGTWGSTSDIRIKNVAGKYEQGLDEVVQLDPIIYTYKGNDTQTKDSASDHKHVAEANTPYVGLIAQEVETIFPGMVSKSEGYIDGVKVDDLRNLDVSPLIYALVNAVKELKVRIEVLEAK